MKKKHLRMFRHILAGTMVLTSMVSVQAQVTNPETWSSFVESGANPSVVDTFRWQLFTSSERNNWGYRLDGGAAVSGDQKWLKVPLSGSVEFEKYSLSCYDDVHMVVGFTIHSLVADEALFVIFSNKNGENRKQAIHTASKNEDLVHDSWGVKGNPYYLKLSVSEPASNSKNGYFQLDSVYSYGSIRQYSLFSGNGNWNDTIRWSHFPPLRHRSALISGEAKINSTVQCEQALLGNGGLHISENGHFIVDRLVLYSTDNPLTNTDRALITTDNSLTVAGKLTVNKQLEVRYTFPEKGKWYFLSFPFDVYLNDIDKRFQLKDKTFSGKGDFLYVQVYDGEKRAQSNDATGNWTVLSPEGLSDGLVFEKGKGYLVALDAAASDNTLTFSTAGNDIPESFGKTASIPVYVTSAGNTDKAHEGWYLCGNPLPSPISLSQITANPALDGNIYIYDGNTYESYPIGSEYVLPPFSAFFVKASADTEIKLTAAALSTNAVRLKTGFPFSVAATEPEEVAVHNSVFSGTEKKCYLKGKILYLSDLPSTGTVRVSDFTGRVVSVHSVSPGSSTLPLSLPAGFYIINVEAGHYHAQHKCVLTQ